MGKSGWHRVAEGGQRWRRRWPGRAAVATLTVLAAAGTAAAFQIPTTPNGTWTGTGTTAAATKDTPSQLRMTVSVTGAAMTIQARNDTTLQTASVTNVPTLPANTNGLQMQTDFAGCQAAFSTVTVCTPSTLGTLRIAFTDLSGNPIKVRNPTLHVSRLGGSVGATLLTARLQLTTAGATLGAPIGGFLAQPATNTFEGVLTGNTAACPTSGCGSIPVTGTVSDLTFSVGARRSATGSAWSGGDAYFITVSFPEDFGDAPAAYEAGQTAAGHVLSDLQLGAGVTEDNATTINGGATGTPLVTPSPLASAGATGDTDDANPVFPALNVNMAGQAYVVPVPYSGGSAVGTLCGWIDFNRNNVFDGGERACGATATGSGTVNLNFTVPGDVQEGATTARFRVGYVNAQITNPTGLASSGEVEDHSATIRPAADLSVLKSGPGAVFQGQQVTYTVTVFNSGRSNVTGAQVADTVPAELTGVTWTCAATGTADCNTAIAGTGATGSGNAISLTNTQINAGLANFLTLTVTGTAVTAGTVTNTATVTPPAGTVDTNAANNTASVTTVIAPVADLGVTKTGPASVLQGDTVTYTVVVTNAGPSAVTGATVSDLVSAGLTDTVWTCTPVGGATCSAPGGTGNVITPTLSIPVGGSVTISVTGNAPVAGAIVNAVSVAPPAGVTDLNAANNSASVTTTVNFATDLAVAKTGPATVTQGSTVSYSIVVTNNGPSNVGAAPVTDTVPANLTGVTWTCTATGVALCGLLGGTGNAINVNVALLPGAGNQVTITVTGTATTAGTITNTATVSPEAGITERNPANNAASATTSITQAADVVISKTGPATAVQGTTVAYTLTVTNNGPSNVTGAAVADAVPVNLTGVTFTCTAAGTADCDTAAAGTGATGSGNAISLNAVQLNAGAGNSLTITVTGTATTTGSITNTATVTPPAGITDPAPGNNTASATTTITPAADLAITKTGPATVVQGNTVTYTVTVTNNGPSNVTGAQIADTVPASLTSVTFSCVVAGTADCNTGAAGTGATGSGNSIALSSVQINAGAGNTLTITITGTATTTGSITNTATVGAPAGTTDPTPANNSASAATTITPAADLAVTKTGTATVLQAGTVTYTITVANNGPSNVTGATVTDTVPANLTGVTFTCVAAGTADCNTAGAGTGATGSGNAISLTAVQLNAGAGNTLTITVTGTATTPGSITNTATVAPPAGTTDPSPANNSASAPTTITPAADLSVTKSGPATVVQGTVATYTVTVTNAGPGNVTGAQIADTVPANFTPVSWTCAVSGTADCDTTAAGTGATGTGNAIALSNVQINVGATVTITVSATAATTGVVTNTATVAPPAGTTDPTAGNNTASVTTTITPAADLAITKTGPASVVQGNTVTYTVTVTNNGPSNVSGANVADTVPANLTGVTFTCVVSGTADCDTAAAGTGATGSGNAIALSNVQINAGAGNAIAITVTGTATTTGSITNSATVSPPAGTTDPTAGNNSASAATTITLAADLAIAKSGPASVVQGNTVTYTITVTNNGPSNVTGATVTDTVPANLTGVTFSCVASGTADCNTAAAGTGAAGAGNAISLPSVQLNAGAGHELTITVTGTATTTGTITNTAIVAVPAGTTDPNTANDTASAATTITPSADLAVTKTGPATILGGAAVTYTITATNAGPSPVTSAAIADTVPADITGVTWTCVAGGAADCDNAAGGTGATGTGNAINLTAVDIPVGASITITVNGTAVASPSAAITNTVTITPPAGTTDPTTANNTAATTASAQPAADISITKTGPATIVQGNTVTYTIVMTNRGPANVTGAQFADTVPANLTGVSFTCVAAGTADCDAGAAGTGASGSGNAIALNNVQINAGAANTVTITVTGTATTTGSITNTATVAPPAGTVDPTLTNNSASADTTITPAADLAIAKSGPASIVQGNVVTYTVTVTNNGPSNVTGATVADTVPANLTGVTFSCVTAGSADCDTTSAITPITGSGNAITLPNVQLAAGAGNSLTITVTGTATTTGTITNTATVTPPAGTTDPVAANDTASAATTITPAADLAVTKTGPATIVQGSVATYILTVTNAGPSGVTGAQIADAVPVNFTAVSWTCAVSGAADCDTGATGSGATGTGNAIALNNVQVAVGATVTITVSATATTTIAAPGATNTATVTPPAGTTDANAANNTASVQTAITPLADLAITKTGPATVVQGNVVTYTVTVTNNGPSNVSGVAVADTVPANLTGVTFSCVTTGTADCDTTSAANPVTGTGNAIALSNVQIDAGAGNAVTITVTGTATATGTVTNTATVAPPAGTTDPSAANDTASATTDITPAADLSITKTGPATVVQDGTVTYTIAVTNNGPSDVTGAQITDTVPAGLTVTGWTCAVDPPVGGGDCDTTAAGTGATGVTNAISLGNVQLAGSGPNGRSLTITVTATAGATGTFTNSATVLPPPGTTDPTTANNSASATTTVTPLADLTVLKAGPTSVVQGNTVTYTITATNGGPSPVTGAQIADTVPANVTAVTWTCATAGTADCDTAAAGTGASGTGNAIALNAVQLNAGAGNSVTITVTGTATTTGTVTNTATVTPPAGTTESTPADNTSSVNTTITPSADLAVTKIGPATIVQGNVATYTVTMTNNGPSPVTGASLNDAVPGAFTGVAWTCVAGAGADCDATAGGTGATGGGNAISLLNVALPVGGSVTLTVTATATTTATPTGVTNTVTVAPPAGTTDAVAGNDAASVTTTITPSADLAVTKTGPATIVQGNTVTYTITVTNLGPSNVTGASVTDTVPSNLTGVTFSCAVTGTADCDTTSAATPLTGSGNAIALSNVQLDAGAGNALTITVTGVATTIGSITNTVTVAPPAGTTDPVPANDSASAATTITPSADLAIAKTGPATIIQNQTITYTLTVTNNGPSAVAGAAISDTVPGAFTGVTYTCVASGAADCDGAGAGTGATGTGNTIALTDAQIDAGAGNALTITVTGTATGVGTFTNTASVAPPAGTTDAVPGNDSDAVTTEVFGIPSIAIDKSVAVLVDVAPAGPSPGDTLRYTVVATNTGTGPAIGVTYDDVIDPNLQFVPGSAVPSSGTATFTTGTGAPFGGSLAVSAAAPGISIPIGGGTFTLQYDALVRTPLPAGVTQVANQGTLAGNNFPTVQTNDPSTPSAGDPTITQLTAQPTVLVDKAVAIVTDAPPTGPSPGDVFEYTLTVTNTGNQNAASVALSDLVDPNVTLIPGTATTSQGTLTAGAGGGATVAATIGTIPGGGGSATVTYRVQVPNPIPAGVTQVQNQAVVTGGNFPATLSNDPATAAAGDPTTLPLSAEPTVGVTKAAALLADADGDGAPSPGDTLLYTITITNTGNTGATGVSIADTIDTTFGSIANVRASQGAASVTGQQLTANLGTIPGGGASATVTYEAVVPDPLPPGVTQVSNQATVSGNNFPVTQSDDPATGAVGDPTVTPLTAAPLVDVTKRDTLVTDADGDGVPSPGDTLLYTVAIVNAGNAAASSVVFNDTVDTNVVLLPATAQASPAAPISTVTTTATSVGATFTAIPGRGGTAEVTFRVRVRKPLPPGVTSVANQATVTGANFTATLSDDPDTAQAGDPTVTPLTATPVIGATKTAALVDDVNANGLADPGDTLAYMVTVTNAGNQDATAVRVDDTVETNLTLVAGSVQTSPVVTPILIGASIAATFPVVSGDGGTATVSYRATVRSPLPPGVTQVANQAQVSGSNFPATVSDDPATGAANDPTVTPVVAKPIVGATKSVALAVDADGDGAASPGDTLQYVVTVTNTGNQDAAPVEFRDTVGANQTVVVSSLQVSPGAPISSNVSATTSTVQADFTAIPGNGGSVTITFAATVDTPFPIGTASVENQGVVQPGPGGNFLVTATDDPSTTAADDPTVTPISAAPVVSRDKVVAVQNDVAPTGPSPGDTLRYTVTLTNSGNRDASAVALTDTLDPSLTLTGTPVATPGAPASSVTVNGRTVGATWTAIPGNGGTATFVFDAVVANPLGAGVTQIRNQGTVSGGNFTGGPTDDPGTAQPDDPNVTPLTANPLVGATKAVALAPGGDADGDGVPSPGDTLRYTVVITNTGNQDAAGVTYSDIIDPNLILQAASLTATQGTPTVGAAPPTGGGNFGVPDIGTIPGGGGSVTISYDATVTSSLPAGVDTVKNQGAITGGNFAATVTDDPATAPGKDPTVTQLAAVPKLGATKRASLVGDANGNGVAEPGDTLLYTVTITNSGGQDAAGVTFSDVIEPNLGLVAGSVSVDPAAPQSTSTVTATSVDVFINTVKGAGGTATVSFRASIDNPLPAGVSFVENQGSVAGAGIPAFPTDDPATGAVDDPTRTPVVAAPVVGATKSAKLLTDADGDGVPSPGDTLLYTVTITNTGNQAATDVAVSDIIDLNLIADGASLAADPPAPIGTASFTPGATPPVGGAIAATFTAIPGGGNQATLTYEAQIKNPVDAGVTEVANQAQISGTNFPATSSDDPSTGAPGDPTITPITADPRIAATKSATLTVDADGNGVASPGDTLAYSIRIVNTGNREATGITFSDAIDPNVTLVPGTATTSLGSITAGAGGGTTVAADIGSLGGGGAAVTIGFRVVITTPLPAGVNQVVNQGSVSGTNFGALVTDDPSTAPLGDPTVTPLVASPVIVVDKAVALVVDADGNGVPSPGDTLGYTITVTNTGNQSATGVAVNDIIDLNLGAPSGIVASQGTASFAGATLSADLGALGGGGQQATVSYRTQIANPLDAGVTEVANQAAVTGDNFPATLSNDPATAAAGDPTITEITAAPVIGATKRDTLVVDADGDGVPSPGDTLGYTITVTNSGNRAATGVQFSDFFDPNVTLVAGSLSTNPPGALSTVTLASSGFSGEFTAIPGGGATATVSYRIVVKKPLPAGVTQVANQPLITPNPVGGNFVATVSDDPDTADTLDPTVTPLTAAPRIAVAKRATLLTDADGDGLPSPGDTLLYTIDIANSGNQTAAGVTLSDIVDPNLTAIANVQVSQGTVSVAGQAISATIGSVAGGGGVANVSFEAQVVNPLPAGVRQVANQASVSGANFASVLSDDPSTAAPGDPTVTPLTSAPVVQSTKTATLMSDPDGNGVASPGDTLLYTITVTNTGNGAATGVALNDVTDLNVTAANPIVSNSPPNSATLAHGVVTADLGTIPGGGGTATVTFEAVIANPLPAGVTQVANQATITGTNFPSLLTDDPATATPGDPTVTPLVAAPVIAVDKVDTLVVDADGNGVPSPGDTLLYTVTVTNTGNQTGVGAVANDIVDPNVTLIAGSVQTSQGTVTAGNAGGNRVAADLGAIPGAGGVATTSFQVRINNPLPAGVTSIVNQAVVTGDNFPVTNSNDPRTPAAVDPTVTAITAAPVLAATKSVALFTDADNDGVPSPGDTVVYVVQIQNVGNQAAANVAFSDPISPLLAVVPGTVQTDQGTVAAGNAGGSEVRVDIGTIPGGGGVAVTFRATIAIPLPQGTTTIANQGSVTGNGVSTVTDDPRTGAPQDPTVLAVTASPLITMTKRDTLAVDADGDGVPSPGDTLAYTVQITNLGNAIAQNIVVDDTPGVNTALVVGSVQTSSATGVVSTGNAAGDTSVRAGFPQIGIGSTDSISFRVVVAKPMPSGVTQVANQATLVCAAPPSTGVARAGETCDGQSMVSDDPDTLAPNDATVTPIRIPAPLNPLLRSTKAVRLAVDADRSGGVSAGDTLEYTVVIANGGDGPAQNTVFTDTVDRNTRIVASSVRTSAGAVVSVTTSQLQVAVGTLASGTRATVTFRVRINRPLPSSVRRISNVGLVTATGVAGVTTDDPSTGAPGDATSTPIIGRTKLSIRKIGPKTAIVGQVVTYTLRVKNTGSQPATAVVVTDRLPAGLSVFRRPAGATVRGRVVTWKIPRIAPGRTVVLTVRVLIARTATGTKTDVATAKAGNTPAVRATLGTRLFRIAPGGGPPVPTG